MGGGGACGASAENPNVADFVELKDCTRDQVFPCPKEGCTHSFQRHSSLEKHLAFGTCMLKGRHFLIKRRLNMLQGSRKVQVPCQLFLYLLKPVLVALDM